MSATGGRQEIKSLFLSRFRIDIVISQYSRVGGSFQAAINESETRLIAAGSGTYNLYWQKYPSYSEILRLLGRYFFLNLK